MAASLDSPMVQWLLGGLTLSLAWRDTTATFIYCKHMLWIILGSLFSCLTPILKVVLQFSLGWGHLASTSGHKVGLSVSTNKNPLCLKMCFCTGSNLNLDTAEELSVFLAILSRLNEADLFPLTGAGHVLATTLDPIPNIIREQWWQSHFFFNSVCLEYVTGTSSRWSFSPAIYRVMSYLQSWDGPSLVLPLVGQYVHGIFTEPAEESANSGVKAKNAKISNFLT